MLLNLAICFAGAVLCLMGILQAVIGARMDRQEQKYFLLLYVLLLTYDGVSALTILLQGKSSIGVHFWVYACFFIKYLFATIMIYLISAYMLSLLRPEREELLFVAMTWVLFLNVLLLIISQFTGILYTISVDNLFEKRLGYPLLFVFPWMLLVIDIWLYLSGKTVLTNKERWAFSVCFRGLAAGVLLSLWITRVDVLECSLIISAFVLYLFILSDRAERYCMQQEENVRLRTDIMLSQIQPHFLYNCLSVIQEVCHTDPEEAGRAIGQFALFLRHNMDSLANDEMISFEKELKHTERYLELQKLRFGEDLRVEYDLEKMDFWLPPLTLQPLVENAVTHGIREKESGRGTVSIQTREFGNRYEVTVKDDGPGISSNGGLERSHVGLANVKSRLNTVCSAELTLVSEPGEGTTAIIILPKEGENHADICHR